VFKSIILALVRLLVLLGELFVNINVNLLAPELFVLILAQLVYKM